MKKTIVSCVFYALFLVLGFGRSANAQNSLNPYDGNNMKSGTQYADCDFGSLLEKLGLSSARDNLNKY